VKPVIPILLLASIIYGQFQTSNAKYRGFSKIDCLGLIIYGIDDDDLFDEIEKLTRSIADETLPQNVKLDYFTECPLYPLSVEFHTVENKDGTVSGTIAVAVEATSESTTIEVQYPSVDEENWYYQIGFMPIIEDRQLFSNADHKSVISTAGILIQKILDQFLLRWVENP
jgi:hypothetical protein